MLQLCKQVVIRSGNLAYFRCTYHMGIRLCGFINHFRLCKTTALRSQCFAQFPHFVTGCYLTAHKQGLLKLYTSMIDSGDTIVQIDSREISTCASRQAIHPDDRQHSVLYAQRSLESSIQSIPGDGKCWKIMGKSSSLFISGRLKLKIGCLNSFMIAFSQFKAFLKSQSFLCHTKHGCQKHDYDNIQSFHYVT